MIDPLSYAAERAWKAGIVLVAAAGNTGYQRGVGAPGLANPAYNPYVIAVGGYDTQGTPYKFDDTVGAFSASSNARGARKPDVVAVGAKLQGLRVPNSFIDLNYPQGLLGTRFFRGSGTSEAAAVTSGTVALLLQKYPNMTPDQVKGFLKATATGLYGSHSSSRGNGALDLRRLSSYRPGTYPAQAFEPATGTGSVELSRGRDHLTKDGVILQGEIDIFGMPFAPGTAGSSWSGGQWNGSTWSGSSWSGSSWSGSSWSGFVVVRVVVVGFVVVGFVVVRLVVVGFVVVRVVVVRFVVVRVILVGFVVVRRRVGLTSVSGWGDSNSRPPAPKAGALPTAPHPGRTNATGRDLGRR